MLHDVCGNTCNLKQLAVCLCALNVHCKCAMGTGQQRYLVMRSVCVVKGAVFQVVIIPPLSWFGGRVICLLQVHVSSRQSTYGKIRLQETHQQYMLARTMGMQEHSTHLRLQIHTVRTGQGHLQDMSKEAQLKLTAHYVKNMKSNMNSIKPPLRTMHWKLYNNKLKRPLKLNLRG